jgi:hypothetical protein
MFRSTDRVDDSARGQSSSGIPCIDAVEFCPASHAVAPVTRSTLETDVLYAPQHRLLQLRSRNEELHSPGSCASALRSAARSLLAGVRSMLTAEANVLHAMALDCLLCLVMRSRMLLHSTARPDNLRLYLSYQSPQLLGGSRIAL